MPARANAARPWSTPKPSGNCTPRLSPSPKKKGAQPGTPKHSQYALGWGQLTVAWAPHPLTFHGGSNVMNLAHIWLDPQLDFALVLVTNIGGDEADQAFHALVPVLYKKFAPPSPEVEKP